MRIRRMMGVAALGAAATSLVFVPGAGAQAPETYVGTSAGDALRLSVFGQELTLGATTAEVTSAPKAAATGFGLASPVAPAGATDATVEGADGTDGSADETCEGPIDQIPGLTIALACSSSSAGIAGAAPTAAATGTVGDIVVNPVAPLLETPLSEVVAPVEDGLGQLLDALAPVTGPVGEGSGLDLDSTLRELIANLFDGADLVSITVGDTASSGTVTAQSITAECVANGATVDVLGSEALGLEPVIQIVVGEAGTSVVADRAGGEPTATVNPSLVTVRSALLPGGEVAVPVGQTIEIPIPEPIGTSTISVAAGETGTDENGNTFAEANAVRLDLLNGEALQGGIELELASCASVAGATLAAAPAAPPTTLPTLPTTGGDGPNTVALASAVALAGVGLALLRRTRAGA